MHAMPRRSPGGRRETDETSRRRWVCAAILLVGGCIAAWNLGKSQRNWTWAATENRRGSIHGAMSHAWSRVADKVVRSSELVLAKAPPVPLEESPALPTAAGATAAGASKRFAGDLHFQLCAHASRLAAVHVHAAIGTLATHTRVRTAVVWNAHVQTGRAR